MSVLSSSNRFFLSHNGANKGLVRGVASRLESHGRSVFFDEWSIAFGESIPGAISTALENFDAMVLFWSKEAKASAWVREEFQASVSKFIEHESRAFVVVKLDSTELPALVAHRKWIDGRHGNSERITADLVGTNSRGIQSGSIPSERETRLAEELAEARNALEAHKRWEKTLKEIRLQEENYRLFHDE
jgi:hypothetical protein